MQDMLKGFKEFLFRGNIVDLAVAVVIGTAFGAVVMAFSKDFIGGVIGIIGGTPKFDEADFFINGSRIVYGSTVTALINFVIVAAVVFFVVVVPLKAMLERGEAPREDPVPTDEAQLLAQILDELKARPRT